MSSLLAPREVVRLLVELVEPKEGMSICDPTCGSAGMLMNQESMQSVLMENQGSQGIMKDVKMMALFITVGEKASVTTKVDQSTH